jgi:hypothetical protein
MALKKSLIILSALLVLTNCTATPQVITEQVFVDRPISIQPRPDGVDLNDVKFHVVTADNLEEFIESMKSRNGGRLVFIALTVEGYESLSINVAELRRYIEQQKELIVYYEKQSVSK